MNNVQVAGFVGSVSLSEFSSGEMLKLRVATTSRRKVEDAWVDDTEWHSIVIWGSRASGLAKIISPGRFVAVAGSLRTRAVESEDGTTRYFTEIVASDVTLGPAGKAPVGEAAPNSPKPAQAPAAAPSGPRRTGPKR